MSFENSHRSLFDLFKNKLYKEWNGLNREEGRRFFAVSLKKQIAVVRLDKKRKNSFKLNGEKNLFTRKRG